MIYAIIFLAIVAGLTIGGTLLRQYPGSVEITLSGGSFEMPLWYFILALVVAIILCMIAFKIVWTVIRLPAISRRFGKNRREVRSGSLLQKGMLAMGKGQWKRAEKLLAKGARVSLQAKQDPGIFLTVAAQAAQHQGAGMRRDQYLLEARQLASEGIDTLSAALSEAQIHLDSNEPAQALTILKQHHTLHYNNPRLLTLESQVYEQLDQHDEVWRLLKSLKKAYPDKDSYRKRQAEVVRALFASPNSSLDSVEQVWSELPRVQKRDETITLAYASALVQHHQEEKAELLLSKAIRETFADPLIHAYTQLQIGSSTARLDKISSWLKSHPDNAYLNYGAAKMAFQSEQFDKAKSFAERSLKSLALPETLALLGKTHEALGESHNALEAYRSAFALTYAEQVPVVAGDVLPGSETQVLPEKIKQEHLGSVEQPGQPAGQPAGQPKPKPSEKLGGAADSATDSQTAQATSMAKDTANEVASANSSAKPTKNAAPA